MPIIATRASAAYGAGFGAVTTVPFAGPFGSFDALGSVSLSGTTSSVSFSNIPSGYKHLQIRYVSRCNRNTPGDGLSIRLNGDSSTNYSRHIIYNAEPNLGQEGLASQTLSNCAVHAAATAPANVFGAGIVDILDYSSLTKNKTFDCKV